MKKTVTVNLNGRVFTMDEDAYQLLDKYLANIRIYFRWEEGSAEIIADFEARIEELFSERVRLGYEVITIEEVEKVIARVGKPADFGDGEPENRSHEEENRKDEPSFQQNAQQAKKTFFRDNDNKMLGGVCSGLAARFGWDVSVVRIVAIVLMFVSSLALVPLYLLAWVIFPAAKTASEKLQMQGMPITVENIGKTVAAKTEPERKLEKRGCMEKFLEIVVALMKICLIGIGCLIGLPLIFALVITIIALFAVLFGVGGELSAAIPFGFEYPLLAAVSFVFVIGIPLAALIYSIIARIAEFTPVNKNVKRIISVIWVLALLSLLASGCGINKNHSFWEWQSNGKMDNDVYTEQKYIINQPFTHIDLDDDLVCDVQIEQTAEGPATIKISGDERLVNHVRYEVEKGRLHLSVPERKKWHIVKKFSSEFERINIQINTLEVKGIEFNSVGNVLIANVFKSDVLKLELDGAGKFRADSLDVQFLEAISDGVGRMILGGKVRKARFEMEGAGLIDALELVADSVYAEVDGVGAIKCNPVAYLDGTVSGIGSLTYKEEPVKKYTNVSGIGKIGKE